MPKLWARTIETHRREVVDAILETTATLVAKHGLRGVTMSQIAEETGIGRATLYKYFPDVESILVAHHERQFAGRIAHLVELRDQADNPGQAVETVLRDLATHMHEGARHGHGTDLHALIHQDQHVKGIEQQLHGFVRDLLAAAVNTGQVRADTPSDELASYCLHALSAGANAPSRSAVQRLVDLTLAGLQPA